MIEYAGSATLIQWIYSGGTLDISGDTRNVSITPALETIDTTAGGDQSGQFLPSFTDWEIAWDGVAQEATAGVTYAQAMIPGSEGTVIVYPFGTAGTFDAYTMQALCMGAVIDMPYSDVTVISNTWRTASGGGLSVVGGPPVVLNDAVAYYALSDVSDATGRGNTLTNNNVVTFVAGHVGNAANFVAASTQSLTRADTADVSTGDIDFTIACWVYPNSVAAYNGVYSKHAAANVEYMLVINDNATTRFYCKTFATIVTGPAITGAAWHLIICWHDATNDLIWIQVDNGTPVSAACVGGPPDTAGALSIGREAATPGYFDGLIDEWGMWKKILTPAERAYLWNGGSGVTYPF